MGLKKRTPKGDIGIDNNLGRIRLRWRYNGQRYALHLSLSYSQENLSLATIKAAEIKLDMLKGCFDTSLNKYKTEDLVAPDPALVIQSTAVIPVEPVQILELPYKESLGELIDDFIYWTKHIKNIDIDKSIDYLSVKRMLGRWKKVLLVNIAEKLGNEK